jgi:hypothetical protein
MLPVWLGIQGLNLRFLIQQLLSAAGKTLAKNSIFELSLDVTVYLNELSLLLGRVLDQGPIPRLVNVPDCHARAKKAMRIK